MEKAVIYKNLLGLQEIDANNFHSHAKEFNYPAIKSEKITTIWVEEGECTLAINNKLIAVEKHAFCFVSSLSDLQIHTCSPDFKARLLVSDKNFMDECIPDKKILSFYNRLFIKQWMKIKFTEEENLFVKESFDELKNKMNRDRSSSFYGEMIYVSFKLFILDLTHLLHNKEEYKKTEFTRKEELFLHFMELLMDHYKEEHEVTYYAEKLFVSPQYLTLIIKNITGKTTNKWIDDTLLLEARKLLKTTQEPVQQIAYYLNFSDQSTFGKFFKKYNGVSPLEYRKQQHAPAIAI
ncbi:AraC family transcriptional regulator [Parabacteroides sp. OttesenSCG-928-K15]|nr:AraC family transcriptional regulator [Parabacteroides sp. OttesenSCG-928-K15]